MFCKPPHPVYIVLFRGDDTDFVGNQEIIVKITTERNISGCKAYFKYMGNIQTFDEIPEDKELHLVFSREQTKDMPLGTWDAELYLIDENGKRMTVNNRIHMLVTNSVGEAYFPDDPQAITVIMSGDKFLKDAEVSGDGKTLTITKSDGTKVPFSGGGGGGGTDDYNDLKNRPSINGTTLTGNVNLATPEQLLLKADKSALDNHEGNTKNPHKVTAAQIGALPLAGGTLTGDLAVGEAFAGSRTLSIASDNGAAGITLQGGTSYGNGSILTIGGSSVGGATLNVNGGAMRGGHVIVGASPSCGGILEVQGINASIKKDGKEVATEEQVNVKADKATTLSGYGITDAATKTELNAKADKSALAAKADKSTTLAGYGITDGATKTELAAKADKTSLAPEYSPSSAYAVGAFVYHDGNIYQCTTAIADGGEAWNAAHWELRKLDDFFTESNSLLTGTIDARLPYPIDAVPSTGVLKDRTLNTTSLASVTVPDNFTDLLIRASVASSLSVTMPEAIATKYGDTFPGEAGEYLITITKTGASEAYVRTIKLEVANA